MATPQRTARDELERIVLSNIAEYGWYAVNIVEGILRLAGPFTRPCVRPAPANQACESDSPSELRPLAPPFAKESL